MNILDNIEGFDNQNWGLMEKAGNALMAPGRLFFGKNYTLVEAADNNRILKNYEAHPNLARLAAKIVAIALLPFSLLLILSGMGLKLLSHRLNPALQDKYQIPSLINARTEENFSGKLPLSPWTPNCVNSQKKSLWGKLYDADPIVVSHSILDPINVLKGILATTNKPNFQAEKASLLEERNNYLHYTYTVEIPSGPLKGTYIDDVDIYYDAAKGCFEIRSASRVGFRDAVHFDFSRPGANKKRIEAIREAFTEALSNGV